jgi:hypothetical protein
MEMYYRKKISKQRAYMRGDLYTLEWLNLDAISKYVRELEKTVDRKKETCGVCGKNSITTPLVRFYVLYERSTMLL